MKISATIITLNEEANIGRCLESLKTVVDEIILVDSFSTDRTVEIARDFGCRVFERAFEGYTDQKNFATEHCQYEWILSLDADEVLSPKLRASIAEVRSRPLPESVKAFTFNRLTSYCGKFIRYGGWYPDARIRFWDKRFGAWEGDRIHEQVVTRELVHHLEGDLLHYSYNSIDEHVAQANKFSAISAGVAVRKGKRASLFLDCMLNPLYTFVNKYVLRRGFLDGERGFIIAVLSAYSNFLKYTKIRMLQREKDSPQPD